MTETPNRPSLAKKHTRKTDAARQEALDQQRAGMRIKGTLYVVNPADISGSRDRQLRRACGYTVASLLMELQGTPGLDTVAAFMLAAEVAAGDDVDEVRYEALLDTISYGDTIEVLTGDDLADAEDDAPEA